MHGTTKTMTIQVNRNRQCVKCRYGEIDNKTGRDEYEWRPALRK